MVLIRRIYLKVTILNFEGKLVPIVIKIPDKDFCCSFICRMKPKGLMLSRNNNNLMVF